MSNILKIFASSFAIVCLVFKLSKQDGKSSFCYSVLAGSIPQVDFEKPVFIENYILDTVLGIQLAIV